MVDAANSVEGLSRISPAPVLDGVQGEGAAVLKEISSVLTLTFVLVQGTASGRR